MNRLAYFGIFFVAVLVVVAALAPVIATHDPGASDLLALNLPPSAAHWFGTDAIGRDVFSRVVFGARISLTVGIVVVAVSSVVGTVIGALAGYYGGWVGYARMIRGQVLKVREYDFVQAARALGAGGLRILFVHILPNAIQPLIVQASLGMAGAVLSEAALSFLGLGVPPPSPSWGVMIEEARDLSTLQAAPHALIFPGVAIALTVLAFNFIGDGLREYLDPRQRAR